MRIGQLLKDTAIPALEGEILLAHVLGRSRTWIIAHAGDDVPQDAVHQFQTLACRRGAGEPLAYITGTKEFFGRDFSVTRDVLIPRPSTEGLVDLALEFMTQRLLKHVTLDAGIAGLAVPLHAGSEETIIDVGTGSGCIAITLALETKRMDIAAVDTCAQALAIANRNIDSHGVSGVVRTVLGDGPTFVAAFGRPFAVISNPPYIPADVQLEPSVASFEPGRALFAGSHGLDVLLPLARAARNNPACTGIILELREEQVPPVREELGI